MNVQKITCCAVACAAFACSAGVATATTPATATLSISNAGAQGVTLTLALRTELQCGRLRGSRPLVLVLPAKEHVASSIAPSAVLIGGRAASRVAVSGHMLTISPPRPRGMLCNSIGMGTAKVVLLPAAGLGNPGAAGTYSVRITHGTESFAAPMKIQ